MITRITGLLESIHEGCAVIAPAGAASGPAPFAYEVLLPAFLAVQLAPETGKPITLVTLQYFEGQGQGSSFIPRLVGFADAHQRDFFELFTTVNGIGNRKALRALARPPSAIARAIFEKDAKLLSTLPEIGKRMAERVIAELDGKVEAFLDAGSGAVSVGRNGDIVEAKPGARTFTGVLAQPAAQDAVAALVALGQQRSDAEEKVRRAMTRHAEPTNGAGSAGRRLTTPDEIVAAVFAG